MANYRKRTSGAKPSDKKITNPQTDVSVRLNKYIAHAGICSRREADQLILKGKIKINGRKITELGHKVSPGDKVYFEDKLLSTEKLVYVLLNKPKDFITTTDDPQNRKTVMQLVSKACPERIYPVGRLDRNTTGVLLFTNDGDLSKKLTHPSHKINKVYQVELNKPLEQEDFDKIKSGLQLDDGPVKVDDIAMLDPEGYALGIEIHSGRNRIVRRIFEALGYEVTKLDRVLFAGLTKKDLSRGKWRMLRDSEILKLKKLVGN